MTARKRPPSRDSLCHIGADGAAKMVDVGDKPITRRRAIAEARVRISKALERRVRANTLAKGDLLEVARLAGIQAAKRTADLIPLCHPLPIDFADVRAELRSGAIHLTAEVRVEGRTGVEMESLTAVAVAALTVIDMGKSIDRNMVIEGLRIVEKHGGRSGSFIARRKEPR